MEGRAAVRDREATVRSGRSCSSRERAGSRPHHQRPLSASACAASICFSCAGVKRARLNLGLGAKLMHRSSVSCPRALLRPGLGFRLLRRSDHAQSRLELRKLFRHVNPCGPKFCAEILRDFIACAVKAVAWTLAISGSTGPSKVVMARLGTPDRHPARQQTSTA